MFSRIGLTAFLVAAAGGVHAAEAKRDPRPAALAEEIAERGWIVYGARSEAGDWDLFLMRPDGSNIRNITNTPEISEAAPRFSFDGKQLLYRALEKDAQIDHDQYGLQGRVMIADADGKHARAIGEDREFPWACWSPDGVHISCLTPKGIHIINYSTGKEVRKLPREGMYQQVFWSADGLWFCGVTNKFGESWTVARMHSVTGKINPVNEFQNCTPDWFPDSKRLIFSHRPDGQEGYGWTQLWMADGDGSNKKLIYGEDGYHIYGGAVSPDGKYVLFTKGKADGGQSEKSGAPMGVMRLADAPLITGESQALRKLHPDTKDGPILELPVGWEPHWTMHDIGEDK